MAAPSQVSDPGAQQNFDLLFSKLFFGSGDPNGKIAAPTGALYLNGVGGAGNTLWVKETSPTTRTGWVAK